MRVLVRGLEILMDAVMGKSAVLSSTLESFTSYTCHFHEVRQPMRANCIWCFCK